ncbi:MAG TPA: hypothetical protein PK865_01455 [Candidatus Saccharibacteria bacterium]|nr:hypothetical protein [Candidatus Saccharibacteria bacterium]
MWYQKAAGLESGTCKTPRRFVAGLAVAGAGLAGVAFASPAFAAGLGIAGISCVSAAGTATLTFYNDGEPETVFHLTLSDGRGYTVTVLDGEPTPPLVLSGVTASTTLSTSWTNEAGYTQNHEGIPLVACESTPAADATADFTLQGVPGVGNDVVVPSGQFSTPGQPVWNGDGTVSVTFTADEGHTFADGSKTKTVKKPEVDTSTPGGPSTPPTDPGHEDDHDTDGEAPAAAPAPEAAPAAPNQAQAPASASTAKKAPAPAQAKKNVSAVPEGGSGKAPTAIGDKDANPVLPVGAAIGLVGGIVLVAWRRKQLNQS